LHLVQHRSMLRVIAMAGRADTVIAATASMSASAADGGSP
jgi:hypothetical protein